MRAEEIEQNILSLVLAMIRADGVKRTREGRGGGAHQLDEDSPA